MKLRKAAFSPNFTAREQLRAEVQLLVRIPGLLVGLGCASDTSDSEFGGRIGTFEVIELLGRLTLAKDGLGRLVSNRSGYLKVNHG